MIRRLRRSASHFEASERLASEANHNAFYIYCNINVIDSSIQGNEMGPGVGSNINASDKSRSFMTVVIGIGLTDISGREADRSRDDAMEVCQIRENRTPSFHNSV